MDWASAGPSIALDDIQIAKRIICSVIDSENRWFSNDQKRKFLVFSEFILKWLFALTVTHRQVVMVAVMDACISSRTSSVGHPLCVCSAKWFIEPHGPPHATTGTAPKWHRISSRTGLSGCQCHNERLLFNPMFARANIGLSDAMSTIQKSPPIRLFPWKVLLKFCCDILFMLLFRSVCLFVCSFARLLVCSFLCVCLSVSQCVFLMCLALCGWVTMIKMTNYYFFPFFTLFFYKNYR